MGIRVNLHHMFERNMFEPLRQDPASDGAEEESSGGLRYEDLMAILQRGKEVKPDDELWSSVEGLEREITEDGTIKESFDLMNAEGREVCHLRAEYGVLSGKYRRLRSLTIGGEKGEIDVVAFLGLKEMPVSVLSDHLNAEEREAEFKKGDLNSVYRQYMGGEKINAEVLIDNLKNPAVLATLFHEVGHVRQDSDPRFATLDKIDRGKISGEEALVELEALLREDDMEKIREKIDLLRNNIARSQELVHFVEETSGRDATFELLSADLQLKNAELEQLPKEIARIMLERDANARALNNMHKLKEETGIDLQQRFRFPVRLLNPSWLAAYRDARGIQPGEEGEEIEISFREDLSGICMNSYQGTEKQLKKQFGVIPRLKELPKE